MKVITPIIGDLQHLADDLEKYARGEVPCTECGDHGPHEANKSVPGEFQCRSCKLIFEFTGFLPPKEKMN